MSTPLELICSLLYGASISLCLDLLRIITLGTKAHVSDPKCPELMLPLRLSCARQRAGEGWASGAAVGVWKWRGPPGGTGLHSGCSDAAELIKITFSQSKPRRLSPQPRSRMPKPHPSLLTLGPVSRT